MKKWVCPVCGYVHEGDTPPEKCPTCGVPGSKFKEMKGDAKLAAEHEYGVYAKTVKNNPDISEEDKKYIFDQLMANFNGECSEVGMYLAMSRVADREGYPEIAAGVEIKKKDIYPHIEGNTTINQRFFILCVKKQGIKNTKLNIIIEGIRSLHSYIKRTYI